MANDKIYVPYEDFKKLEEDSVDKSNVLAILGAEFPDDTCQLIAIKAVLGYVDPEDNTDPIDPNPDPDPDPGNDPDPSNP